MSVCVASGASRFGTDFGASFRCSKYVMFSITFGTPVRQNTLCVTFGARRRPVPSQFLGAARACWATNAGQEIRYFAAPCGFTPTTSPESTPNQSTKPPQEHLQTSQVVSSVIGCAMHIKWPDGIGRGSWEWGNPRQESANEKSGIARTDLPYHWVSPSRLKRVGPPVIIFEYYIYLSIHIWL